MWKFLTLCSFFRYRKSILKIILSFVRALYGEKTVCKYKHSPERTSWTLWLKLLVILILVIQCEMKVRVIHSHFGINMNTVALTFGLLDIIFSMFSRNYYYSQDYLKNLYISRFNSVFERSRYLREFPERPRDFNVLVVRSSFLPR